MLKNINLSLGLAIGLVLINTSYAENQGGTMLPAAEQTARENTGTQTQDASGVLDTKTLGTVKAGTNATPQHVFNANYNPGHVGANTEPYIQVADTTNPAEPSTDTTLEKVTVEADAGDPYDDPNWANDSYNKAYTIRNSSTATKTDTPLEQRYIYLIDKNHETTNT